VAGRVEHDPDLVLGLELGERGAGSEGPRRRLVEILDGDVEVAVICWRSGVAGQTGRTYSGSYWNERPGRPSGGTSVTQVDSSSLMVHPRSRS
jgi:hypothetical protein